MKYLVLNQLGTPESPEAEDVGVYLNEFLMDANIISIPRPIRDIVVKWLIVPKRREASAEKYAKIWTEQGSPLAFHTENLRIKVQKKLGDEWQVLTGMRYGEPSLKDVSAQIQYAEEVVFCPLYPQYARATVWSALERWQEVFDQPFRVVEVFYNKDWFIKALSEIIKPKITSSAEHILFSYHGLPISQNIHRGISYEEHCLMTTEKVRLSLGLEQKQVSTSFQSRVGPLKWLAPSTEEHTHRLLKQGVRHLKVACPSFTADCLETLEEIGLELKQNFLSGGGESFELISCLNDSDLFVDGLCSEILKG